MVRARAAAPRLFGKVVIVGVGLMGGSLGLAVKKRGLAREVVGLVRRRQTIARAKALGAIDSGTLSPAQAFPGADLVVLATPVETMPELLRGFLPLLPAGCLVTDVGSTKVKFLRELEMRLYLPDPARKTPPPRVAFTFASSHPMAGSEKEGVEHARRDLYDGSHCLLVRTKYTPAEALHRLEQFWRAVGCRQVSVVGAEEHDRWVAAVSHLPHAAAACLVNVLAELSARDPRIGEAAGPGFRDTTRVAAGSPALWTDILLANRGEVCATIGLFRHQLSRLEMALNSGETRRVLACLEQASTFRQSLERPKRERRPR
jgi:prephenate dehydrogenase